VFIDTREPDTIKNKLKGELITLEVGDYLLNDELYERKSAEDFINSIMCKRLWDQLTNLNFNKEISPVLAVTGNIWKALSGSKILNKEHFYYGAIHTIATKFKVPLLYFYDDNEFVDYLKYVDKRSISESIPQTLPIKKNRSLRMLQRSALSCIPGISGKKAEDLLIRFKTIKNISNASIEELSVIGEKTAKNIFAFFNNVGED